MFDFFFVAADRQNSPVDIVQKINERKIKADMICVQGCNEIAARARASREYVILALCKKMPSLSIS